MNILRLLTALLLTGLVTGASAQGVSFGPRIGVNFASFSTDAVNSTAEAELAAKEYEKDRRALAGAMAGVLVNIPFSETFSFQPEVLFSAKGYKQEGTIDVPGTTIPMPYEFKTIMNYIEVPLLAKFSFGPENRKISLLAGPYIGYLAGGRVRREENGQEIRKEKLNFDYDNGEPNKFQRIDAGAIVGASGSYRASSGTYMIDVRYNYGLTDNFEYNPDFPGLKPQAIEIYNRTFSVSFGYAWHTGTRGAFKPAPVEEVDPNTVPNPTNPNPANPNQPRP